MSDTPTERLEQALAAEAERLVSGGAFAALLARSAENALALASLSGGVLDLAWRNLRLAGAADLARLGGRLNRTEDKLERLLQEIEALRDESGRGARRPPARAA